MKSKEWSNASSFTTEVFGKWILAGEHAVLRGAKAVVFPVFSKSLKLTYKHTESEFSVQFAGSRGEEFRMLFNGVMERSLDLLKRTRSEISGEFLLDNEIEVGAGMGASAALCVAWGRWLVWKGWVKESGLYDFCRELENLFHGESSGVDVAVAISAQGLVFKRDGYRESIDPKWQPRWYLSYCGKRGLTSECVNKVKKFIEANPEEGRRLDQKMNQCSERAIEILTQAESTAHTKLVIDLMNEATEIFRRWGLVSQELREHMNWLESQGALATKPTGSGDGGYVLSLWSNDVSEEIKEHLVPVHRF